MVAIQSTPLLWLHFRRAAAQHWTQKSAAINLVVATKTMNCREKGPSPCQHPSIRKKGLRKYDSEL